MRPAYTIEERGHEFGFPGWWTVFRNGNPVIHFPYKTQAEIWIANA